MSALEGSIDIGCPVNMTPNDLRTFFFRRFLGQHATPDMSSAWELGGDVMLDGELDCEPTAVGGDEVGGRQGSGGVRPSAASAPAPPGMPDQSCSVVRS